MQSVPPRISPRLLAGAAALGLCGLLWAGCRKPAAPAPDAAEAGPYVGSAACAECHAEIFQRQAASPHARTLMPVPEDWSLGREAAEFRLKDEPAGITYGIAARADGYYQVFSQGGGQPEAVRIEYLLGSGHHGISPMTFDGKEWRYLALSYYAKKGWDFSPMHDLGGPEERRAHAMGWPVSPAEVEKCFGCHSTRLQFDGAAVDMRRSELGVKCESCHGPGRAHVEAVRAGKTDRAVQNPGKWPTSDFLALCQQCHNENSTLDGTIFGIPDNPADPGVAKHHVYGMEQSACFKQSAGAMRCTTCHDPHAPAESDPAFYVARCLQCHQPGGKTAAGKAQAVCPVNPRDGCLACHMPKVQVEKYTEFADHWIRAKSPFAPDARKKAGRHAEAAADRLGRKLLAAARGGT